jgi:cardiolipin synthase
LFIALAILVTLSMTAVALWVGANLATTEKRLLYRPRRLYASDDADFRRALGILLGPPLVGGNRVSTLINGDRIFPPMLEAIHGATVSVTFETFVFRDAIGAQFCEALSAAARRGVKVHILLDWLGSRGADAELAREQIDYIEADIRESKRMVSRRWARRSNTRRVYEQLALLLRSQL